MPFLDVEVSVDILGVNAAGSPYSGAVDLNNAGDQDHAFGCDSDQIITVELTVTGDGGGDGGPVAEDDTDTVTEDDSPTTIGVLDNHDDGGLIFPSVDNPSLPNDKHAGNTAKAGIY